MIMKKILLFTYLFILSIVLPTILGLYGNSAYIDNFYYIYCENGEYGFLGCLIGIALVLLSVLLSKFKHRFTEDSYFFLKNLIFFVLFIGMLGVMIHSIWGGYYLYYRYLHYRPWDIIMSLSVDFFVVLHITIIYLAVVLFFNFDDFSEKIRKTALFIFSLFIFFFLIHSAVQMIQVYEIRMHFFMQNDNSENYFSPEAI